MPATGPGTAVTKPPCPSSSETPWPVTLHCAAADYWLPLDLLLGLSTVDRNTSSAQAGGQNTAISERKKGVIFKLNKRI